MSPVASKKYHESLLLTRSPELLSNTRINPPIRWIYDIHQKWFADNPGDLNNCEPDFDKYEITFFFIHSIKKKILGFFAISFRLHERNMTC